MLKFYENNTEFFSEEFIESLYGTGYFIYYTQKGISGHEDEIILTLNPHIFESYHTIVICNENLKMSGHRHVLSSIRSKGKRKPEIFFSYNDLLKNGQRVGSWDMV